MKMKYYGTNDGAQQYQDVTMTFPTCNSLNSEVLEICSEHHTKTPTSKATTICGLFESISILTVILLLIAILITKQVLSRNVSIEESMRPDGTDSSSLKTVHPNFVFIMSDDVGWNSLGYENFDLSFATPHLTQLARKGIIMSQYYSQELCSPARASLLTGRYPLSIGMQFGTIQLSEPFGLDVRETLFPQVLKSLGGYTSYIIGKWNLGHYCPQLLPTARGFDFFIGYLDGLNYYWSKRNPSSDKYQDFMYSDSRCYDKYDGPDLADYSSMLYADKAVRVIQEHDYATSPMFLYFSAQAVHDPFTDYESDEGGDAHLEGISAVLVGDERMRIVRETVVGGKRQQYALALSVLDLAVDQIYRALESTGHLYNTYIIFTSDNGGCHSSGGKNGPLRGTKGSLFEGGTKVDAFIYSPLLPTASAGTTYTGLMHVSDWFPTLLGLAGLSFTASAGHALDGVDQSAALRAVGSGEIVNPPRDFMLYNMYVNVSTQPDFDMYTNTPVAVRNARYKLLHAFVGNPTALWYDSTEERVNDDELTGYSSCSQTQAMTGTLERFLFDLLEDPYESINLFGQPSLSAVQEELYAVLEAHRRTASVETVPSVVTVTAAYAHWKSNDMFIQPWIDLPHGVAQQAFVAASTSSWPSRCTSQNLFSP